MGSEGYHEPLELLSEHTRNLHRAIVSLIEELEAVDWYQQRAEAASDADLKAVLVREGGVYRVHTEAGEVVATLRGKLKHRDDDRVVPGDVVEVHQGQLWINSVPVRIEHDGSGLREALGQGSHPLQLTRGGGLEFGPVQVGPEQYLVLGDNRGESHDGRAFGLVHRRAIFGRALSVWMRQGQLCWHRL